MTRGRWFVALAIVAAITGVFAVRAFHPRHARDAVGVAAPSGSSAYRIEQATSAAVRPQPRSITAAGIAVDPDAGARDWSALGERVIESKYAQLWGIDAARLIRLPPTEAWQALKARASDGDSGAATAALLLASDCSTLALRVSSNASTHGSYVDRLAEGLPEDWSRLLRTIDVGQQQRQVARIADCEGVGGAIEFALMVIDRFLRADDPQTQLEAALDTEDDNQAIADLRRLTDELHDDRSRLALAERLIKSRNAAEQVEGRAMLDEMASGGNAKATVLLASCLYRDCGFFVRDRESAVPWVERAAGLGDWSLLGAQIGDLDAAGKPVDAMGWALYRLELAQAGCFEFGELQISNLALAAKYVFSPKHDLTGILLTQARDEFMAIHARWAAQADAYLGCAG